MNKREIFKKTIAWSLIAVMANPAAMLPAYGRDTDIFLSVTGGASTAEPNILLVLGTNDRMNIAEPWREYPGAYDSHVEYLWNDINVINNGAEQTTEIATKISTAVQPTNPFSVYGFWAGATLADRQALWTAAKNYANATEPGDPGPRNTWRVYNDASWFYWLPAGTAETDARLRSPLFNRFRGYQNTLNGTRGGIAFSGTTNYQANNACAASIAQLIPSTVFYPSAVPRNAGKYLNDQWFRWENWLAMDAVNVASYPGSQTVTNGYIRGYLDSSGGPPASWSPIPATAPLRDNTGGTAGTSQGQPIRLQNAATPSGAGWTDPKADLGGYEFQAYVNGLSGATLQSIRGVYGYSLLSSVGAAGTVPAEKFSAWLGNRDNSVPPAFGSTGTAAYYDSTSSPTSACVPATGGATATCINVATGGVPNHTVTKTRACTYTPNLSEVDALGTTRKRGGTCTAAALPASCVDGNTLINPPQCASIGVAGVDYPTDPLPCAATPATSTQFIRIDPRSCAWSPARASVNIATCQWSGRQSTYIEGQGWYYYLGSCQENGSTASCTMGGSTVTLGGTTYNNVTGPHANPGPSATYLSTTGCSNAAGFAANNYFYGSTCQGNVNTTSLTIGGGSILTGPSTANCTISGVTASKTIRGTAYANVVAGSATSGCNNNADTDQTCLTRYGVQCDNPTPATACPATTTSVTGGGTTASNNFYLVANRSSTQNNLVHDCLGDGSAPGYMRAALRLPFGTTYNTTVSTTLTTAAYTSSSGQGVNADATKNIDVYSVNYLNWKFGPKGPNGDPIGRKTRLQIAKDALSDLVQNTDGVRFGLMVHNRTAGCSSTTGTILAGSNLFTQDLPPGWLVGSNISVAGVGAGGAALNTSITAINGNTLTLAASAINPATTGSISNGSPTLTVASAAGFTVDSPIRVVGAGAAGADLITTVTSVAGLVLTLATNAGTTVAGAAVGRAATNPSTTGTIAAGSPALTVADATGLVVGQQVTVTGAGASGTDLYSKINAIAGSVITLANNAGTDVTGNPVAIASFTPTMQSNPCSAAFTNDGANIAYKITRMGSNATDPDYANRSSMILAVNNVVASSRTPLTETLYEAYRYYSGRTPRFGTLSTTAFIGGSVTAGRDTTAVCAAPGAGCPASGVYRSPMLNNPNTTEPAGCQKNFIILITNGQPEDDWTANAELKTLSYAGALGTVSPRTTIDASEPDTATDQFETAGAPFGPTDLAGTTFDGGYIWLDELAYFMSRADVSPGARNFPADTSPDRIAGRQSVITYTIGFAGVSAAVVANAANKSGGTYYVAEDSSQLSAALIAALVAIREWNPTVASPTVPISALNRTESSTDVYLAFFQPDPSQAWRGTVKKFRLGVTETDCGTGVTLCLTGQTVLTSGNKNIEKLEVDPVTGSTQVIVDPDAVSYWNPLTLMDGGKPDVGGTGYQLINTALYTPDTRKVYTFLSGGGAGGSDTPVLSLVGNDTTKLTMANSKITNTLLGNPGMTAAARETLINFMRGANPGDGNCSDGNATPACTAWRAWPHFDVQHSKPAIVTYDVSTTPVTQYLYYLAGNGMLHAVDTNTGQEKWAFVIEEALPKINALMTDASGQQLDIADGAIEVFVDDKNGDGIINTIGGTDRVWLFFGLRRGGRVYYALDITVPDAPQFKWKITNTAGTGMVCTGTSACVANPLYNELGQTWSTPRVGKVRYAQPASAAGSTVLIFGGGYDPAEDSMPPGVRSMGRAVYVVDADTATVVQSWGVGQSGARQPSSGTMAFSVPSDITALNTDSDAQGFLDRLYVGDTGGNLWRFDINNPDNTLWKAKQLANLSSDITPGAELRKFLFAPAAVKQNSPVRFDAVYIGSGDREHPLVQTNPVPPAPATPKTAADMMFMVMDRDTGLTASDAAPIVVADLVNILNSSTTGAATADLVSSKQGWLRGLDNGEKVVNSPTVFFNKLRFGTYAVLGQSNACTPPGEGRLNEIDALTGDLFNLNTGDGLTAADRYYSSYLVRGFVSSGQLIIVDTTGGGGPPPPPGTPAGCGKKVYHVTVADGRMQSILVGTLCGATRIYWYMEPEQ